MQASSDTVERPASPQLPRREDVTNKGFLLPQALVMKFSVAQTLRGSLRQA